MSLNNFDIAERINIATKIYSTIQKSYGHWEGLMDYDLEQEYRHFLDKIVQDVSRTEFTLAIMELIGTLSNGHSWVNDAELYKQIAPNIGFEFDFIDDKWVIIKSISKEMDLVPGTIIEQINEEPFEDYYQKQKKYIGASSERAKRSSFGENKFLFPQKFTLKCLTAQNTFIEKKVDQEALRNDKTIKKQTNFEARWLQNNQIGYIKIKNFGNPTIEEEALKWVETFFDAQAIIIDVRGNKGGSTPVKLTSKIMTKKYRSWTETAPLKFSLYEYYYQTFNNMLQNRELDFESRKEVKKIIPCFELFKSPSLKWNSPWIEPLDNAYSGTIVILVDRNTRSAGEDFVLPFKDNKRAVIIGETTRGSTGEPYMIDCGKGLYVFIGMKRAYFPDGRPFEGVGIEPDIIISPSIEKLQMNKNIDVVLNKALDFIKNNNT